MMSDSKPKEKTRLPYQPPRLEEVRLEVDEAVLVGCKRGGAAGPFTNNCAPGQGCPTNSGS